jgi:4-amino-4-deoxy-L-arabinose transferase-like glycosyltransferase
MMKIGSKTELIYESRSGLFLLLFFSLILIFNDLWLPGLPSYDDCAKAQRGWEMLQSGDFATPKLAGKENFDHPPFYLWTLTLSFGIFGKTEFAARFPGALMAFFSVWIVYSLGVRIKNKSTGWWAGFFLTSSYMFLKLSRRVQTDIPFLLFASLALYYFLKALDAADGQNGSKKTINNFLLWGFFTGVSGLIKSVFVIFPLFSPLIYLVFFHKKDRRLISYYFLGGLVAAIAAGWWYVYEFIKYGDFFISSFADSFVGGHISGMSNLGKFGFLGYLYEFLRHFWLWLPLTIWAVFIAIKNKMFSKNRSLMVLAIYMIFPLIVLSLFGDKTIRYVMFLFSPLLLITAYSFDNVFKEKAKRKIVTAALIFLVFVSSYVLIRPVDLEGRTNYDYCLLGEAIDRGEVIPTDTEFYHYREDYGMNQLPLLFYTGINMKGVVYNENELRNLIASRKRFFLLIKKDLATEIMKAGFDIEAKLEKRLLLKPNKYY